MIKVIFAALVVVMLCAGLGCGVTPVSPDAGPSIWTDAGPSIWTDKADYDPGEVVTVYGAGFSPGPVSLTVTRPDGEIDQIPDVSADSSGSFAASYPLDGIMGTYILNATDSVGQTAQTTFTDGATEVSVGEQVGTLTYGTAGSVTYTITVWGSGVADVSLSISGLPAGASATFDPNPIQGKTGEWPTKTSTLTIFTTATTPAGTYAFTVHAGGHDGSGTLTISAVCITYYKDADGDTYGVTNDSKCLYAPEGDYSATQGGDCDDTDTAVNPGATEVCNDIDDDCDGLTDEEGATGCATYYKDSDGDSYGVTGDSKCLCAPEDDYTATVGGDYDDNDATVNPGATEIWYDGVDQDCDGANDYDADGDTYVATGYEAQAGGTAPNTGDCDDTDAAVNPGATEVCNGIDDDCDDLTDEEGATGCTTYYKDSDDDSYGVTNESKCLCAPEGDYTATVGGDDDDNDASVNPGATEIWYDGVDQDCDGANDYDADGDTYVATGYEAQAGGTAPNTGDCDDTDAGVNPGATEVCNGIDDDCDDLTDEEGATGCTTYYKDSDDDSYGVTGDSKCLCAPEGDYTATVGGDDDDNDASVNPGATEVCNGIDDDCDGLTDEEGATGCTTYYKDSDGDSYGVTGDSKCLCAPEGDYTATVGGDDDDNDASVNPGATEIWYDGVDQDCDGANDYDADGDTYVATGYEAQAGGTAPNTGDCDDTDASVNPGATEVCNGIDDDCDGLTDEEGATGCTTYYKDSDGDSYGVTGDSKCLCAPEGDYTATVGGDDDDNDASVNPGATEIWYDGVDQDCDGANDYDADGDTYVATAYNGFAGGTAPNTGDCDDNNASVNPGATEIWYDGTDQDCDGANDYDADGDTYVARVYNGFAGGTAPNIGDCDDNNAAVHPGATEVPNNGKDDDCDPATTFDVEVPLPSATGGGTTTPGGDGDTTTPSPAGGRSTRSARCFIATAAYGTPNAEQIDVLREFRDVVLLESTVGSQFVAMYYRLSPPVAEFIAGNELLRTLVREFLVDPIVWVVDITGDLWQN